MVTKRVFSSFLKPSHLTLSLKPDYFAPAFVAIPTGFLIASLIQGDILFYIVSLASLGVLTSLDLRTGPLKTALGFLVSTLGLIFTVLLSPFGRVLSLNAYPSLVLVAVPPAFGVVLCSILFSSKTRYKVPKENLLVSGATGIGLALVYSISDPGQLFSLDLAWNTVFFRTAFFLPLALAANAAQMLILHLLDNSFRSRRISLAMMPASFFSLNSLTVLAYFASGNQALEYSFLSSLAFLPLLAVVGASAYGIGGKVEAKVVVGPPTIVIAGDRSVKQGRPELIRVTTNSMGRPKDMAKINAILTVPSGKREALKLSRKNAGRYVLSYNGNQPGQYSVQVDATTREGSATRENFSFTIQSLTPPPSSSVIRRVNIPIPKKPLTPILPKPALLPSPPPAAPARPAPAVAYPVQTPARPSNGALPKLDNWDPKIWLDQ
ncbi:MAG TPA: hypothetical protein VE177_08380, partial [Candidatus Binatus sp.]|nr:hypothetical protein [Candidatus Binatus sp.]